MDSIIQKLFLIFFVLLLLFVGHIYSQVLPLYTDQECLSCHGKPEIHQTTLDGSIRSLYVDPKEWQQDIHYKKEMTCVHCHVNANPILHFREGLIDVDCSSCHPEEAEEYQKNIHLGFTPVSPNKELPLCYHCHTKHHILRHDDPLSSVHERNIGQTCGECHPEVMITGLLQGSSMGKISGHRKGDLSESFDMMVCIRCHYEDAAHGSKRAYPDFCSRCHAVKAKLDYMLGPTHVSSQKWVGFNYLCGGLALFLFFGAAIFVGYRSRKGILTGAKKWYEKMKIAEDTTKPEAVESDEGVHSEN